MFEDGFTGEDLAGGGGEETEHIEFPGGQPDFLAAHLDGAGRAVNHDVAERQRREGLLLGVLPAEHGVDAREQLGQIEGFTHVIIRAQVEAPDLVGRCVPRGQNENRHVLAAFPELVENVQPGPGRHHDVEHDELGAGIESHPHAFISVGGEVHVVALHAQVDGQAFAQRLVVLHDEDPFFPAPLAGG